MELGLSRWLKRRDRGIQVVLYLRGIQLDGML
jgi:hypothetical protein